MGNFGCLHSGDAEAPKDVEPYNVEILMIITTIEMFAKFRDCMIVHSRICVREVKRFW